MRLISFIALVLFSLELSPAQAFSQAPSEQYFKVGVIAPLSGALAEYGIATKNGIELARLHYPKKFRNIRFIYEDSRWDAKTSVSAFNKLRTVDKVSLVYNWGNPTSEAVAPLAEQYQIPLLAMSLDPKTALGRKFVIRTTNSAERFSEALANYLKGRFKNLGVVIDQNTYVQGLYNGLKAHLGLDQTIEIVDQYSTENQDFKSSIAKIRSEKYDAVGVFLVSGQISLFYRQLKEQKVNIPTFGTDFFESSNEIEQASGGMNGAVYSHLGISDEFKADYLNQYGNDYQIAYGGNSYDIAKLLGDIFGAEGGSFNAEQIIKNLTTSGLQQGVCGEFSYVKTARDGAHFSFPIRVKKIEGEAIKLL